MSDPGNANVKTGRVDKKNERGQSQDFELIPTVTEFTASAQRADKVIPKYEHAAKEY